MAFWDLTEINDIHFKIESGAPLRTVDMNGINVKQKHDFFEKNINGWGFNFIYRKEAWKNRYFDDVRHGEDLISTRSLLKKGKLLHHIKDDTGVACYIRHKDDRSIIYPQYIILKNLIPIFFKTELNSFL